MIIHNFEGGIELDFSPEGKENLLIMNIHLVNESTPLTIQTPKVKYNFDDQKINILFDSEKLDEFYKFILNFEKSLGSLMSEKLKELSQDIVTDELLKTSIKLPKTLNKPLYMKSDVDFQDIEIYNKKHEIVSAEKFIEHCENNVAKFILIPHRLIITPTFARIKWTVGQIKFYTKKSMSSTKKKKFEIYQEKEKDIIKFKQIGINYETKKESEPEHESEPEPEPEKKKEITINL